MDSFIIKGDIAYSKNKDELVTVGDGYLVCRDGICQGIYEDAAYLPDLPVIDHSGKLVLPGMIDLHIHAPQYAFRGTHMDEELMDWLNDYTFKEEAKYADLEYANLAYEMFADGLKRSATTRACVFGTIHRKATELLMDKLEEAGLVAFVGKVNQDRNSPEELDEKSAEHSLEETGLWLKETAGKYENVKPIITPRFIPTCSDELMEGLGNLAREHGLPVQSHLSENPGEIELVLDLVPDIEFYGQGYEKHGMLGPKSIMAHCIYSVEEERMLLKESGTYVAHCPSSNLNLRSGIAPIRMYLDMGLSIGLGSDVAGGESESIFEEIKNAIRVSKMVQRYHDADAKALTFSEAFWLATASGGSFFGSVGKFEPGFEFDAIVIDDAKQPCPQELSIADRVERSVYLALDRYAIIDKYVKGYSLSSAFTPSAII